MCRHALFVSSLILVGIQFSPYLWSTWPNHYFVHLSSLQIMTNKSLKKTGATTNLDCSVLKLLWKTIYLNKCKNPLCSKVTKILLKTSMSSHDIHAHTYICLSTRNYHRLICLFCVRMRNMWEGKNCSLLMSTENTKRNVCNSAGSYKPFSSVSISKLSTGVWNRMQRHKESEGSFSSQSVWCGGRWIVYELWNILTSKVFTMVYFVTVQT